METNYTPLSALGEFGLIDRMVDILGTPTDEAVHIGIGDDAAVYAIDDTRVHVVTTDALIEGVHFDPSFMPLGHLGMKAIAVNVSDVVAMNATPRFAVVALGLPPNASVEHVSLFYEGVRQACALYGLTLVGGDTTMARQWTIAVTVIGEARAEDVVYRRGAQPGDLLCVTGDVGAAYAGLQILLDQRRALEELGAAYEPHIDPFRYVIGRQLAPRARLDVIRDWAQRGVRPHALIDVSDGIASEVHHLCRQSGTGALIDAVALPLHDETRLAAAQAATDADTFALFGGEDYELLFALPEADLTRLDPDTVTVIGLITEAHEGVRVRTAEDALIPLEAAGYTHFDEGD